MKKNQQSSPTRTCWLVDNGSLRPAAILRLRELAEALTARTGFPVEAVSVLHSDRINAAQLGGVPAQTLGPKIRRLLENPDAGPLLILPCFIGPSLALVDYLPQVLRDEGWNGQSGPEVRVAAPLAGQGTEPDPRLAAMMAQLVLEQVGQHHLDRPPVVLVDHGSPIPEVTAVRDGVARQLAGLLKADCSSVTATSMESRPGPEYAFNQPLLDQVLGEAPLNHGAVVIAQLFLNEGRHAGPDGDIATICRNAEARCLGLSCFTTPPLAGMSLKSDSGTVVAPVTGPACHPGLLEILEDRLREAASSPWLHFKPDP